MRKAAGILAYLVAGIPAAIGVALVARYAFNTSDTVADGIGQSFFFGMIAVGAFSGPAFALAVYHNNRRAAGVVLGVLSLFAIAANWSHTLASIAERGAGSEAERARAKVAIADDRAELARITREREAMSAFTAATAETVAAAREALAAAERSRAAECGNGDPKQRGRFCRDREADERTAAEALSAATLAKAATDTAARLDNDAAAIRARLAKAPAIKGENALGEALGRLLAMSALTAATFQQGLVSGIAELLIAAALALPELLRKSAPAVAAAPTSSARSRKAGNVVSIASAREPGDVGKFATARLHPADGASVAIGELYQPYRHWCENEGLRALGADEFGAQFAALCSFAGVETRKVRGKPHCLGLSLVA